jgi:hypothetical protein
MKRLVRHHAVNGPTRWVHVGLEALGEPAGGAPVPARLVDLAASLSGCGETSLSILLPPARIEDAASQMQA